MIYSLAVRVEDAATSFFSEFIWYFVFGSWGGGCDDDFYDDDGFGTRRSTHKKKSANSDDNNETDNPASGLDCVHDIIGNVLPVYVQCRCGAPPTVRPIGNNNVCGVGDQADIANPT